jgi:hypothetical protein
VKVDASSVVARATSNATVAVRAAGTTATVMTRVARDAQAETIAEAAAAATTVDVPTAVKRATKAARGHTTAVVTVIASAGTAETRKTRAAHADEAIAAASTLDVRPARSLETSTPTNRAAAVQDTAKSRKGRHLHLSTRTSDQPEVSRPTRDRVETSSATGTSVTVRMATMF